MSIAITAPEKFELQDLVGIELMLRFARDASAQIRFEPPKGEDAELRFSGTGPITTVEVQVKGSHLPVDLDLVLRALCHFPAFMTNEPLIKRVYDDPERMALLVVSGRCDDTASTLVADPEWLGLPHPEGRITEELVKKVCEAGLKVVPSGDAAKSLHQRRKQTLADFFQHAKETKLADALRRAIVIEWRRRKDIVAACRAAIVGVPEDRKQDVLNRLLDHAAQTKRTGEDAYPGMRQILADARGENVRPSAYVERGAEAKWLQKLSDERVLLLSGRTRVGKSDAARWIGAEFANAGYEMVQMHDVESADRLLQQPSKGFRLVILDDPLDFDAYQATRALQGIERIIKRLKKTDALVVAQGQEPLLAAAGRPDVEAVVTAGRSWCDLSDLTHAFQASVWRRQAKEFNVPERIVRGVDAALLSGELELEPGCIVHLAAQHDRLGSNASVADFLRLAHEDADAFGNRLREQKCEDVLRALWIASTSAERLDDESMAFILGAGGTTLPGVAPAMGEFAFSDEAAQHLLREMEYESAPALSSAQQERLEFLEMQGVVSISKDGAAFTHPFYRSSAQWCARPRSSAGTARLVELVRRALSCRSPRASRAASRNLETILQQLPSEQYRVELWALAADAVRRSRFVTTRDLCLSFLLRHLAQMPETLAERVADWVDCTTVDYRKIVWLAGEGYTIDLVTDYRTMFERWGPIKPQDAAKPLAAVREHRPLPDPKDAVTLARFFDERQLEFTRDDLRFFLGRDEASIRGAAIETWLSVPRGEDDDLLDAIFLDPHPSVAKAALEGCIRAWSGLHEGRKNVLIARLAKCCATPGGAAAVLPVLTGFGREDYTGSAEETPWDLFAAIFPAVVRSLPARTLFNDSRFYGVVEDALDYLTPAARLEMVDAMIDWLLRQAARGEVLSDYAAGAATLLVQATRDAPQTRGDRVAKLLAVQGTSAILRILADLIAEWDDLHITEREWILTLVRADRVDRRWIRALALTRRAVRDEVLDAAGLLGFDWKSPHAILNGVPAEVVDAAVCIFSGQPGRLWFIGTHHPRDSVWKEVIEHVAQDGTLSTFEIAWSELARRGDDAAAAIAARIIPQLSDPDLDRVFNVMLRRKVHSSGQFMMPVWMTMFACRDRERIPTGWANHIDRCLPAILDGVEDLKLWLEDPYAAHVCRMLENDLRPLLMLANLFNSAEGELLHGFLDKLSVALQEMLSRSPPRLYKTYDTLKSQLASVSQNWYDERLVRLIDNLRGATFERRKAIESAYQYEPPVLTDWLEP